MKKCEWCGKKTDELVEYTDALNDTHSVCKMCYKSVENCECRKCGETVDTSMMINGLCMTCVQADIMAKSKKKEEARLGVDTDVEDIMETDVEFTDQDYEKWLTMRNTFSPADMAKNKELRRIWIMVKFNAIGVYEPEVISHHIDDIEKILDRNLSKLIGKKCRLLIGNDSESRKEVRQREVLDYENEVYILKV